MISRAFPLIVFLTCITYSSTALAADDCIKPEKHETVSYLLVDRSDRLENKDGFDKSLTALESMLQPGERLIVGLSTGKGSDTTVLMDLVKPKGSMWVSMLKTRADTKKFTSCFDSVKSKLAETDEEHDKSALLETLGFVSKVLKNDSASKKRLFLYSDMMQNSPSVSFYSMKPFDPETAMKKVEKEYLLSKFPEVSVLVAGTGATVTDAQARRLEAFWTNFFEKTGGSLDFYGPVLLSSN